MAETLGSLCDKLTIVKLKQWHSEEPASLESLRGQEIQLRDEIDEYVADALGGRIPVERLTFAANKVYKKDGNSVADVTGTMGEVMSRLATVNCELWHEVEKGYNIEQVPAEVRDGLVKQLAVLNLARNRCIDHINQAFQDLVRGAV